MSSARSKPFSGKKKKEQLQLKKQIKNLKLKTESQEEYQFDMTRETELKPEKQKNRIKYVRTQRSTHFLLCSLKSDWDVVGATTLKPQYNLSYQNEIIPLNDVKISRKICSYFDHFSLGGMQVLNLFLVQIHHH